ncbi:hypothetical protein F511_09129 [Dorcoceras hygrometricum]|uniref:IST1-like protein n=1 Tax=Dorcoceras hygrometricum TaxID=472368 RepID=A0A2Z7ANL4_9LAMI|nr:hypothetical protein F511_09129 [Dorcoceras hygrometricum]
MVVGNDGGRGGNWKKAMRIALLLIRPAFNSSKCKTTAKMAVARIKLLRNRRDVVIRQMRRDIAMLLESREDATARIRVEHVIREQNIMAANELIELFCELVVTRLSIIAKQRECPADLKEGISSLLFAAPRCSEIPELLSIRDVFQKKYGRDFVSAATDLRPNASVNRMLIEKLSVKTPTGEIKLKVLKEIAKEYQVDWDTTETEMELLKPLEERIEGPVNFASATSLPVISVLNQAPKTNHTASCEPIHVICFQDLALAAEAAAEKALAAAEAVADLAHIGAQMTGTHNLNTKAFNSTENFFPNDLPASQSLSDRFDDQRRNKTNGSEYSCSVSVQDERTGVDARKILRRQSYDCQTTPCSDIKFAESDCDNEDTEMENETRTIDTRKVYRRHSYNDRSTKRSDIKFDESDYEDDSEKMEMPTRGYKHPPPNRQAPQAPVARVHPKLPDYDTLTARFEALKHHK